MRIGVIGTGRIGGGLARAFAAAGHDVYLGSRDPAQARSAAQEAGAAGGGTYTDVARDAEVLVLAVPWRVAEQTARALPELDGTIVIDTMNPYASEDQAPLPALYGSSGAEKLQKLLPGARVVKGWNHVYAHTIRTSPDFDGQAATVFLCGDDAEAKETVAGLAREIGFDPVDAGPLDSARFLEPVAGLVIRLAIPLGMGFEMALRLMRR